MSDKFSKSYGCIKCDGTDFETTPKTDSKGKPYWSIECVTCGNQFNAWPVKPPETPKLLLVKVFGLGQTFCFVTKCLESAIGAQVQEFWNEIDELSDTVEGWEYAEIDPDMKTGDYTAIY